MPCKAHGERILRAEKITLAGLVAGLITLVGVATAKLVDYYCNDPRDRPVPAEIAGLRALRENPSDSSYTAETNNRADSTNYPHNL